jgi:hypothetical protein
MTEEKKDVFFVDKSNYIRSDAPLRQQPSTIVQSPAPLDMKVANECLLAISEGFKAITNFLGKNTLPEVLESNATMQSLGAILNGLVSSGGRGGLDARTIKQDATDSTYRVLEMFERLKETIEARKNGDFKEEALSAEDAYNAWKLKQDDKEQG